MSSLAEIVITLTGGRRVDAQVGRHTVRTDQPVDNGGQDTAPSPFQLFLASVGTCAGIFVQGFCAKRNIPYEGIRIHERAFHDEQGALVAVDLEIEVPASFPEQYREALVRVADQCSVKRAIAAQPRFNVMTVIGK